MNIMLTCAGRRNYLIQYFRDTLRGQGQVFAADTSSNAPAMQEADKAFVLPHVSSSNYIPTLLDVCKNTNVHLLISLNDLELPILAAQKKLFTDIGTIPVVSSFEVIDICFDKYKTYEFLQKCGLPTAKTYLSLAEAYDALESSEINFPVIIKPRWGSASIGIEIANDKDELAIVHGLLSKRLKRTILADASATDIDRAIMIQQCLTGQEYGMDVVNDLSGNYVTTFIKRKLTMRAGETDRAMTEKNPDMEDIGATISRSLRHIGNLDCDVFVQNGQYFVLELNPRFGGGYPFSHTAGANIPAALIAWANGVEPEQDWFRIKSGLVMAKCDRVVTAVNNADHINIVAPPPGIEDKIAA